MSETMRRLVTALVAGHLGVAAVAGAGVAPDYAAGIEQWRHEREQRLTAVGGWLSVSGLFWLHPGANSFGTAEDADVKLPPGTAPAVAGSFEFDPAVPAVRVSVAPGADVRLGGEPVQSRRLAPDTTGAPDVLELAPRLTLHVIERSGRFGIRMKDTQAETRTGFRGLSWYPVDPDYRVEARWVPYEPVKRLAVPNVLGQVEDQPCPGFAEFELGGHTLRLEPVDEGGDELFFIFRDATSGHGTYGAGRFLYAGPPADGKIVLDFNKAYSPPCAFTRYATCPLPPAQNRLPVAIEAGELDYDGH